jgi:phosphoserine phosphatase RsbU/P
MDSATMANPLLVLDSINDGVYVTDTNRRIVYWNRSAERITGWRAEDVVGRCCHEGILCHRDKDGHRLCGEEHCPLHRAIVSGKGSTSPIILFANSKEGDRVPVRVSVAPIRDEGGRIVGGVETFRDLWEEIRDMERARRIQSLTMRQDLPADDRIAFRQLYTPRDVVGGDYHAIARISPDVYGFLLADVCGHGVPAALYTMYLRSLWEAHLHLLPTPGPFASAMNKSLCDLIDEEEPFAVALCGAVDLGSGVIRLTGCGTPPPLWYASGSEGKPVPISGLPLGVLEEAAYTEVTLPFGQGDCLLLYTDGAVEVTDSTGRQLGTEGLAACLGKLGYPQRKVAFQEVEEAILRGSDRIRLDDDLTFLEVRRP